MKFFVYALCKRMEMVIAALSCPDEKTAKLAYVAACQDVGRDLEDSLCGIVRIDDHTTINVHDRDGRDTKLSFQIGDFEDAELQTKTRIREGKTSGWTDNFMRSVEFALEELTDKNEPTRALHSITEEEVEGIVRTELFPKLEHGVEAFEHEVEGVIHSIFSNAAGNPVAIPQSDYERQAASGGVQPKLAVESHDHSIPLREKTDETIIKGIALAACKDIAVAIEREKRIIELLSTPQTVKELEKVHVEILAEKGFKPIEIATMIYPDTNDTIIRQKSQWISNHIQSLKKQDA